MPLFCKDCLHHVPSEFGNPDNARCDATRRENFNLVTGASKVERSFCEVTRMEHQLCGPDGKLFDARAREAA